MKLRRTSSARGGGVLSPSKLVGWRQPLYLPERGLPSGGPLPWKRRKVFAVRPRGWLRSSQTNECTCCRLVADIRRLVSFPSESRFVARRNKKARDSLPRGAEGWLNHRRVSKGSERVRGFLDYDLTRGRRRLHRATTVRQADDERRPDQGEVILSKPEITSLDLAAVGSWLAQPQGSASWRRTQELELFGKHHRERHSGARRCPLWFGFHSRKALEVGSRGETGGPWGPLEWNRLQRLHQGFGWLKLLRRKHAASRTRTR